MTVKTYVLFQGLGKKKKIMRKNSDCDANTVRHEELDFLISLHAATILRGNQTVNNGATRRNGFGWDPIGV